MQGSRTVIYNLTRALIEKNSEHEYYLYCTDKTFELPDDMRRPNVHKKLIVPSTRIIRLPISFPVMLAYHGIDVFHCQYMGPPFLVTPYVVTLHDILHETYPELYPSKLRYFMSKTYPFGARRASKILTVSEYSKKDIMNIYGIPEERITVIYNAVSDEFFQVEDQLVIDEVKKKYRIDSKYIFFVGRLEPRKNIPSLIKAFHFLKEKHKLPHKLVIAGMKDFKYQELFSMVKALNLTDEVIFTGRVEQQDLPLLYNGAELFVYPSYAEGFGLPPLEAMACGTPVITSNTTSLPEVVGNAGVLIDPWNVEELGNAMLKVISDDKLKQELKERGLKQSKKFSWNKAAEKLLECYEDVVK